MDEDLYFVAANRITLRRRSWGWVPPLGPEKRFGAYFWFAGWDCLALGVSVCLSKPNIEIHVPFGFFRIGWE